MVNWEQDGDKKVAEAEKLMKKVAKSNKKSKCCSEYSPSGFYLTGEDTTFLGLVHHLDCSILINLILIFLKFLGMHQFKNESNAARCKN